VVEIESVTQRVIPEIGRVASVAIPANLAGEEALDLRKLRFQPRHHLLLVVIVVVFGRF